MSVAIVSGAAGLVGSEAVRMLTEKGMEVIGIDNDMRAYFFGAEASTRWNREELIRELPSYKHIDADINDEACMEAVFSRYGEDISLVIHAAAQPSHDWAARDPSLDFKINAVGTMSLLEATRKHAPRAVFIFTSTNKVYGDRPNTLPLVELDSRWEIDSEHGYYSHGIDEMMSVDQCLHSLFGASKISADILVQEYGRYFGLRTACFRGGCLTGPMHSGAQLHGFLSYLVKCALTGDHYTIFGHKGKQVRDNIHVRDLSNAFWHFYQNPRVGEVYNIGGGRMSNCSVLEAIQKCEVLSGRPFSFSLSEKSRIGDHIWWISDTRKFRAHYPGWVQKHDIDLILEEMTDVMKVRFAGS
jgi:CDP-paratose 2-epimerase